mmetsp:Transcript_2739/g.8380  ORF Transcript_2739/g.8380 Transcript_2739/m.8380 type:complete len:245 (+) Transcript_2739:1420-2154(+)
MAPRRNQATSTRPSLRLSAAILARYQRPLPGQAAHTSVPTASAGMLAVGVAAAAPASLLQSGASTVAAASKALPTASRSILVARKTTSSGVGSKATRSSNAQSRSWEAPAASDALAKRLAVACSSAASAKRANNCSSNGRGAPEACKNTAWSDRPASLAASTHPALAVSASTSDAAARIVALPDLERTKAAGAMCKALLLSNAPRAARCPPAASLLQRCASQLRNVAAASEAVDAGDSNARASR